MYFEYNAERLESMSTDNVSNEKHDHRVAVGSFFQTLGCNLLKANECTEAGGDGIITDCETFGCGAGVEVKASSNRDSFRIDAPQLESHSGEGFVVDLFFYVLFSYKNQVHKGKKTIRALAKLSPGDLNLFLFRMISSVVILDARYLSEISQSWRKTKPLGRETFAFTAPKTQILKETYSDHDKYVRGDKRITFRAQTGLFDEDIPVKLRAVTTKEHLGEVLYRSESVQRVSL